MTPAKSTIYQLRISVTEIEPLIWRRVLVSSQTTLHELHRVIQLLFDWYDYHLYDFRFEGRRFEAPDAEAEGEDSSKVRLSSLQLRSGMSLEYVYDFGDGWTHRIDIEDTDAAADPNWIPWVLGGARRGPPEDCGGPHRYAELQRLLTRPMEDLEGEDREFVEWLSVDFDPDEFSLAQARHALMLASAWGTLRRKT